MLKSCAETVLSLMRSPEYCIYGGAKVDSASDLTAGENRFNEVSQGLGYTHTCHTLYPSFNWLRNMMLPCM